MVAQPPSPIDFAIAECLMDLLAPVGDVLPFQIEYWAQLSDYLIALNEQPAGCIYSLEQIHQAGENIKWLTEQT